MKNLIYILIDPRTDDVRYVGKSVTGLHRPRCRHGGHCWSWEENLKNEGLKPRIEILESFPDDLSKEKRNGTLEVWERYYIALGRHLGLPLTNLTKGGEGASREWTEEQKKHLRKVTHFRNPINFGRKLTEEERRKIGDGNRHPRGKYKKRSPEAQAALSRKLSLLRKGNPNIIAAQRRRWGKSL